MPKGIYAFEMSKNPNMHEKYSLEHIYSLIDGYTEEYDETNVKYHKWLNFIVALPPLNYEGITLKGIFFSQGVDMILNRFANLPQLFHSMAYSMRSSYPWSKKADALFTLYQNDHRENWFKRTYPDRADKILIPLEDGDFTNEYYIAPVFNKPKDIDIITVSRFDECKNLDLIASALKLYREKYKKKIKLTCIVGKDFGVNFKELTDSERAELRKIQDTLVYVDDYIEFIPRVTQTELVEYYSRSKLLVLGSLLEGKNRSLREAALCNTPVIAFSDLNKYTRGENGLFAQNAGFYVPKFDAESLADTIFLALNNLNSFTPRKSTLKMMNRKIFVNTCIDSFPYYAKNIPDYVPGRIQDNLWIDLAMQDNYQISFMDFLYGKNLAIQHVQNPINIKKLIDFFYARFKLEKETDNVHPEIWCAEE